MRNRGIQSEKSTGVRCRNANGVRVDCGCAPGGGINPSGCGACWPCAFDVTFSGLTWRDDRSTGGYLWALAPGSGPFRLHLASPDPFNCEYAHFLSNLSYNDNCFTLTDSDGHVYYVPGQISLFFGPLNNPVVLLQALVSDGLTSGFVDGFSGSAASVPATIANELTGPDSVPISDPGYFGSNNAIAWGGTASLTAVGTCNAYFAAQFATVDDSSSTLQFFGGQTAGDDSTVRGAVNLPAGDYTIFHAFDGLRYAGKDTWQINNGTDGFVAVAQDPTTGAITELGALGFSSTEFADSDGLASNESIQNADGIVVSHPGGYLGIKLKCADYNGNSTELGDTGEFSLPTFCVCVARGDGAVCTPCIEFGDGPFGPLPPGSVNIQYSRSANGGASTWFVSDSADGFNERVGAGHFSGGSFVKTSDLGASPGTTTVYGSIADVEAANAGQNGNFSIDGGYISISNATLPDSEKGVIWKICPGGDICASGDGTSCPDTVHVSVSGGFFDGLEVDISKNPSGDSASTTWGDPGEFYSSPGAFIQCSGGTLTLTLESDVAGPCTMSLTADGTGPCPTGRTWTVVEPVPEGCTVPTSVSVT